MICMMLLGPILKTTADLIAKQISLEKTQILQADGDRVMELMGRAIRMAGYRNVTSAFEPKQSPPIKRLEPKRVALQQTTTPFIVIEKRSGYQQSDSFYVRHEIAKSGDFDCLGNALTHERTHHGLALQGFKLEKPNSKQQGDMGSTGSLMCQSYDRQGRLHQATLANGVKHLMIEEIERAHVTPANSGQKLYRIRIQMADGRKNTVNLERTFATRNLR